VPTWLSSLGKRQEGCALTVDRNLFLGKTVRLAKLTKEDATVMASWTEDAGYLRLQDTEIAALETPDEVAASIDRDNDSSTAFAFGIRRVPDDALVGKIGLYDIEWANRTAWLGIGIGSRSDWDKGHGSEAMSLVIAYAFDELNLHRLQLTAISYNSRALRTYEKLGFTREGVYREFVERDGKRHDLILYGLLRPEWRQRQGERA
jgi:RimJ/RimL family protein N-acetyltransferase